LHNKEIKKTIKEMEEQEKLNKAYEAIKEYPIF